MWRLRRETERGWNDGFHINTRDEAQALCQLLNKLEREVAEAKEQYSNLDDQVSSAMMVIRGLERERDRLAEALRELCETLLNDKPRDITESLYKAGDALAAWKGGSDDKQTTKDETEDGSPKVGTPPRRRERRER
jgi:chromosome segregation ATPase